MLLGFGLPVLLAVLCEHLPRTCLLSSATAHPCFGEGEGSGVCSRNGLFLSALKKEMLADSSVVPTPFFLAGSPAPVAHVFSMSSALCSFVVMTWECASLILRFFSPGFLRLGLLGHLWSPAQEFSSSQTLVL